MMTLHDTIELVKKLVIFGVIAAIGIFILVMLFRFGGFLKESFFPTPDPAPESSFGKLPAIVFPESNTDPSSFTYVLDTLTGTYPEFGDRVDVYKIEEPLPDFLDVTRAKTKAVNIDLITAPKAVGDNVYFWEETIEPYRKLQMNVVTDSFLLTSSYTTYQPLISNREVLDSETAIEESTTFLETMNAFPETINTASTSARPLVIRNNELSDAESLQEAQLFRIDYYHSEVGSLPIYYPEYPNSIIYTLVSSARTGPPILEARFSDQTVSEEFSDYPMKSAEQAFTELEEGKAHIASAPSSVGEIKIKDITLGYFLGETPQEYLMPIIVFHGDNGFIAYISAITGEFIE